MLESMDVQLKHPFSMLIVGSRGVGKTMFAINLLKNVQHIMAPIPNYTIWCYAKHQPELYMALFPTNLFSLPCKDTVFLSTG